jgi:6-phosphogluconolactonase (cycloisomerase 2 family)
MRWQRLVIMAALAIGAAAGTHMTAAARAQTVGAVYTATNDPAGNVIVVYDRDPHGGLVHAGAYPTGGIGTGAGLGNQGGLRMTADGQFLLAVNAGSNDISVLEVAPDGLVWRAIAPSGGTAPISVAASGRLVYVLNAGGGAGGVDAVVGFRLSRAGQLTMIPGSTRALSAPATGPAQVEFSPDGRTLVVTEKGTSAIDVFMVDDDGRLSGGMSYASQGQTPFGFAFGKRNQFFVSEAFGGSVDASAISSYQLTRAGQPRVVSPSVPTTETAACWVVVTGDGRFLYTTNTGSGSISGYQIRPDGTIALLDASGVTAAAGPGPIDMALSGNSRFLYALHAGIGAVSAFRVEQHGQLVSLGLTSVPVGSNGLAAR